MTRSEQIEAISRALDEVQFAARKYEMSGRAGDEEQLLYKRTKLMALFEDALPADAEPEGVTCAVCGLALTEPPTVFVNVLIGAASSVPSLMKPAHQACVPSPFIASPPSPDQEHHPPELLPVDWRDFPSNNADMVSFIEHRCMAHYLKGRADGLAHVAALAEPAVEFAHAYGLFAQGEDGKWYLQFIDGNVAVAHKLHGEVLKHPIVKTVNGAGFKVLPIMVKPTTSFRMSKDRLREMILSDTHDIGGDETVAAQADEIAKLKQRLEISPEHGYDGIDCRDETIRLLDAKVARLEAQLSGAAQADAKDAARYRFMRQNIDYDVFKDGSGHYFHNQRGEFSFCGPRMPPFEELLDAAMADEAGKV